MKPIKYMTSLLTFYIRGEIKSEQNFVVFRMPNTILGLIPLGAKTEKMPINQIASTTTNFSMKFGRLLLGFLVAIFAVVNFSRSVPVGIIILLIGIGIILDAFEVDLVVSTTSGQQKKIDFFIFDKGKADEAEQQINEMISWRLSDTNVREQTDRVVEAISKK